MRYICFGPNILWSRRRALPAKLQSERALFFAHHGEIPLTLAVSLAIILAASTPSPVSLVSKLPILAAIFLQGTYVFVNLTRDPYLSLRLKKPLTMIGTLDIIVQILLVSFVGLFGLAGLATWNTSEVLIAEGLGFVAGMLSISPIRAKWVSYSKVPLIYWIFSSPFAADADLDTVALESKLLSTVEKACVIGVNSV